MNVDGATAVIYADLGFARPFARGLFYLSPSIGSLAYTWEQMSKSGPQFSANTAAFSVDVDRLKPAIIKPANFCYLVGIV